MEVINDLLDKRGNIYSDRPNFTVVGELMGLDQVSGVIADESYPFILLQGIQGMPLKPYGEEWREQRKVAHAALSPTAVKKYHKLQERLAVTLCDDIIERPLDFFASVRLWVTLLAFYTSFNLL